MSSDTAFTQAQALALDILDQTRATLMVSFRFLDVALWRMPFAARTMPCALATDGYRMYFDPLNVITRYRESSNELLRDYLHCILHCVFRHPFDDKHADIELWDTCCDVAVEATAMELCGARYASGRDAERDNALERLKRQAPKLTAQKIYRVLLAAREGAARVRRPNAGPSFEEQLQELFERDYHGVWTRTEERHDRIIAFNEQGELVEGESDGEKLRGNEDMDAEEETNPNDGANSPGAPAPSTGGPSAAAEVENGDRFVALNTEDEDEATFETMDGVRYSDFEAVKWKDITAQIQMDLEAFTGKIGSSSGTFMVNLSVANRKTFDYRDFLKRFSAHSEELKVSTEEFDYVYYTYGLHLYKNMPLVEPLEYQESDRVRDFVIAIDTSASCAGSLVQKFIEKTYDVLKSESGFGRKMNVHVIQCDCDIRKDTKITSVSELDSSFSEVNLRGYGGTDFRPVFKYVDDMVAAREFSNLKGLIYLTDGLGTYPDKPPEYDTAFVFVDESMGTRRVPPWAMKVVMDEDQIMEL